MKHLINSRSQTTHLGDKNGGQTDHFEKIPPKIGINRKQNCIYVIIFISKFSYSISFVKIFTSVNLSAWCGISMVGGWDNRQKISCLCKTDLWNYLLGQLHRYQVFQIDKNIFLSLYFHFNAKKWCRICCRHLHEVGGYVFLIMTLWWTLHEVGGYVFLIMTLWWTLYMRWWLCIPNHDIVMNVIHEVGGYVFLIMTLWWTLYMRSVVMYS